MFHAKAWFDRNFFCSTQAQTLCLKELSVRSCPFGVAITYCIVPAGIKGLKLELFGISGTAA